MKTNLQILTDEYDVEPTSMPKEIKKKWLKALRSGEYEQTDGYLYDQETGGFCCLGVLEHVLTGGIEYCSKDTTGNHWEPKALPSFDFYDDWNINANSEDINIVYAGKLRTLAELNDDGLSFKKIANVIEKQVIGV